MRKFKLGDLGPYDEAAIRAMTPSERIALAIKLTELVYPPDPKAADMSAEQRREARKSWPVSKFYRA